MEHQPTELPQWCMCERCVAFRKEVLSDSGSIELLRAFHRCCLRVRDSRERRSAQAAQAADEPFIVASPRQDSAGYCPPPDKAL